MDTALDTRHPSTTALARQPDPAPVVVRPRRSLVRRLLPLALLLLLAGAGYYGCHWWTVGRFEEVTDDAFLQADKVTVSPRIAGVIASVNVADNQPVRAGDVLARIDDRDYQIALTMAQSDAQKAQANLLGVGAAIVQQGAQIDVARATVDDAQAALSFAGQESARYHSLLQTGSGTLQRQQQTDMDLRQKQAALTKARASLESAEKQVDSLQALKAGMEAGLAGAQAKVEQARLNLTYTTVTAPIAGVAGDRALRVGQFVAAGSNLVTLVPMGRDIYLVANFKETQVGQIAVGQAVHFTIDAFGDHEFHGRVASFSPGTGSQFALLPPENATGNFTKIAQRVPVKIVLETD
ncbi:MAG: HlyD family secretion protein, partial [Janthinobacterium lividum]